ncbi:MAG: class I SAM-dependent methyltransferase [Pseudomonadota bacterium]
MNRYEIFQRAFSKRAHLFSDPLTTAFRLFNGAADGIEGIAIDRYGEYCLVQTADPELTGHMPELLSCLCRAALLLPVEVKGILCKDRTKLMDAQKSAAQWRSRLVEGHMPPSPHLVLQDAIRAEVDLTEGQHTGLFLDMRTVRKRLAAYCPQFSTMLNLFCYTGMFSVHALKHGVTRAVNIDLSKSTLARVEKNYRHNGYDGDKKDLIYGDALQWMATFRRQGRKFSFAVFDPPLFARTKKGVFSIKKDFKQCLEVLQDLVPGGMALTVIHSPAITLEEYRSLHPQGWKLEFLEHESEDFACADTPYLKAGLWKTG